MSSNTATNASSHDMEAMDMDLTTPVTTYDARAMSAPPDLSPNLPPDSTGKAFDVPTVVVQHPTPPSSTKTISPFDQLKAIIGEPAPRIVRYYDGRETVGHFYRTIEGPRLVMRRASTSDRKLVFLGCPFCKRTSFKSLWYLRQHVHEIHNMTLQTWEEVRKVCGWTSNRLEDCMNDANTIFPPLAPTGWIYEYEDFAPDLDMHIEGCTGLSLQHLQAGLALSVRALRTTYLRYGRELTVELLKTQRAVRELDKHVNLMLQAPPEELRSVTGDIVQWRLVIEQLRANLG